MNPGRSWPRLADLSPVEAATRRIIDELSRTSRVWVVGTPGTGRSTLQRALSREIPGACRVEVPAEGADAAVHTLIQLAAASESEEVRLLALQEPLPLDERARRIVEALSAADRVLVLLLPGTWAIDGGLLETDEPETLRVRDVVRGALSPQAARVVFITDRLYTGAVPWEYDSDSVSLVRLERVQVNWEALSCVDLWGDLLDAAEGGRESCENHALPRSPIAVRLLVALTAMGASAKARSALGTHQEVEALAKVFLQVVEESETWKPLRRAAAKLARARYPLPRQEVERLGGTRLSDRDRLILTQCIGYGGTFTRLTEAVRRQLLTIRLPGLESERVHSALARYHGSQDGVSRCHEATETSAPAWLERLHHLGHGGASTLDEWTQLRDAAGVLPRDFLWDRARSQSRDHKMYQEAAQLYEQCTQVYPDDCYAWHYLAYNLERAHTRPVDAESAYARAVQCDPEIPWWNSRHVRFLISRARFRQAAACWREAVARIETPSDSWETKKWLASNLHRWIVQKWLDHARVREAREVLAHIPQEICQEDPALCRLRLRLEDASEVALLGEAVYLPDFPVESRWKAPTSLPDVSRGEARVSWHPARVLQTDAQHVQVVFATTDEGRDLARVLVRGIPASEWEAGSGQPALTAAGFWFIGIYGDGHMVLVPMKTPGSRRSPQSRGMGYWDFWQ